MRSTDNSEAISGQPSLTISGEPSYDPKHYFHAFLDRAGSPPVLLIDHPDGAIEIEGLEQMRALRATIDRAIRLAKAAQKAPTPFWRGASL